MGQARPGNPEAVLLHSGGCHQNTTDWVADKPPNLFPTVPEAGKSKVKVLLDRLVSGEDPPPGPWTAMFSRRPHMVEGEGTSVRWCLFYPGTGPIQEGFAVMT